MFPTSMEVFGVRNPDMNVLIKEWWPELIQLEPQQLLEFSKLLVDTRIFECNKVAYEILWKNKKALVLLTLSDLENLGRNMDNWVTVDTFSIMLSGWAWREYQISDEAILEWLASDNRWWRRAAVVSTVNLNLKARGGTGDVKRTLMICEKVVDERDDMIVKALSWALRELSKRDKPAVEKFMILYDSRLAGRVKREVLNKLVTGKKNN
jgi:3-methyladenine DNA glycosylase AlkD